MRELGFMYLHVNGTLHYKPQGSATPADFRESEFCRAFWPVDTDDRETAWTIVVEALASGAVPEEVFRQAAEWGCDDADGKQYALRIDVTVVNDPESEDGQGWIVTPTGGPRGDARMFGTGPTILQALAALAKTLGYAPSKWGGKSFARLVSEARPS